MTDTPDTTDDLDPEQSNAVANEAAAAQAEGLESEALARDFQDYVTQCSGVEDEDPYTPDQEFETLTEDAASPDADLIAQTQSAIKATQAVVNAVAAKSKKKKS